MSDNGKWIVATKNNPCPICQKTNACKIDPAGEVAMCITISQGAFKTSQDGAWFFHRLKESPERAYVRDRWAQAHNGRPKARCDTPAAPVGMNWTAEAERLRGQMTPELLANLAESTGVAAWAWEKIGVGWATEADLRTYHAGGAGWNEEYPDGAYAFPEHSGDGRVVGLSLRAGDGRKGFPSGAKRGLIVPANLHNLADPVLIVEGASDVAACCVMGLAAVGRPNNRGGAEDLAIMLDGRAVLVVGERDGKPGGAWPGRDGAKAVAAQLAGRWGETVKWTLPPLDTKDVREWLKAKLAAGVKPADTKGVDHAE